jgi:hypothetical protein
MHRREVPTKDHYIPRCVKRVEKCGSCHHVEDIGLDKVAEYDTFDTKVIGDYNIGHEFGTTLSAEEKQALVAYLKSL